MIKRTDKHYKIQVTVDSNTLTYNYCTILESDDDAFLRFSDKYDTIFRVNKSSVIIIEELKE